MKLKEILCRWLGHKWDVIYVREARRLAVLTLVDKCLRCGLVQDHKDRS